MSVWRRFTVAIASGAAVATFVGGVVGIVAGLIAMGTAVALLSRVESPVTRRERARARADLPVAADLLAAALRAGAPPDRAVTAVGEALGGPVGGRLTRVGRAMRLGATPAMAWQHLADVPGGERLAAAAARSAERGTALSRALDRQAADLRTARVAAAEAAVRRVGVLTVLPLGLCFLPAFLLIGVVPVVAAVLGDVLRAL